MPNLLATVALPASFLVTDVAIVIYAHYDLGFDAKLYSLGAQALLAGADPWAVSLQGVALAAPPSSILAYCLTAWLPPALAGILWVGAALAVAAWALRRLALSLSWLLFPPLFVAIWNGGLDAFLPAAYIAAPAVAPFFKVYAFAGLIAERRLRSMIMATILIAPTLLLVPQWLSHGPASVLAGQSANLSAWGNPLALAVTVPALFLLGWRRGWYYAVPALWPWTQLHYAVMAIPAIRPVAAAAWCTPVGVVAEALVDSVRRVMSRRSHAVDP